MSVLTKCRCGNTKPKLDFVLSVDPPKKVRSRYWQVSCKTCGISGPKRDKNTEAINDWNDLVGEIPKNGESTNE